MIGIQSTLYTAAIALCAFSAGILRDKHDRLGRPVTWFTTFLLVAMVGFVLELLMVHPAMPLKGLWLGLRMGTSLLIAPCLWLAVKESVEGVRPTLTSLGRKHRAAIATGLVLLLPLIERAHLGLDYNNPADPPSTWHSRVIHGGMLGCIAIFAVQVPYYVWRCRALLLRADGASRWLQYPLLVALTTWMLGLLRTVQCISHAPRELDLVFALTDVGVTVGAMYLIVRRNPAAEPVDAPIEELVDEVDAAPDDVPSAPEEKYARSRLDAATRNRIRAKVETALGLAETCRDSLLNLRSFSRSIGEKAHYVSQVINQDLKSSFYELVNQHRVAQARQLLRDAPDQTVFEIALAVGFNSKSTFNTAFRRHTGMTPSEYRAGKR